MSQDWKSQKGADRLSTLGRKMGLKSEFLSDHHQTWPIKHNSALTEGVKTIFKSDIIFPVFEVVVHHAQWLLYGDYVTQLLSMLET